MILLFIYFWLHWVFIALCSISLVAVSRSYSCSVGAPHCGGFSCGAWALGLQASELQLVGSVIVAQGLVALGHVGSFRTRDQTRVPCIGSWILIHCAIREVLNKFLLGVLDRFLGWHLTSCLNLNKSIPSLI